jgi:RNA polymerase sigma factor (sigma-70 family)
LQNESRAGGGGDEFAAQEQQALTPVDASPRQHLVDFIQEHEAALLGSIRVYVVSFGLAPGAEVQPVATEIVQETVIEALSHADQYVTKGRPMAWLLGIALNIIRRRRTAAAKLAQHEWSLSRLALQHPEAGDERAFLEQFVPAIQRGPEQEVEDREQVAALLSLVSAEDQRILRLALLEDFKRSGLAAHLGISPNAARMRLARALDRLRAAVEARWNKEKGETDHA